MMYSAFDGRFKYIAVYILAMATTIQVSEPLMHKLKERKMYDKESYEDVIWDLLEDTLELSEATKKNIRKAETEFKQGRFVTHEQLKNRLRL